MLQATLGWQEKEKRVAGYTVPTPGSVGGAIHYAFPTPALLKVIDGQMVFEGLVPMDLALSYPLLFAHHLHFRLGHWKVGVVGFEVWELLGSVEH